MSCIYNCVIRHITFFVIHCAETIISLFAMSIVSFAMPKSNVSGLNLFLHPQNFTYGYKNSSYKLYILTIINKHKNT